MGWQVMFTTVAIILGYLAISIYYQKRGTKAVSFYLADRKVGVWAGGLALAATFETLNIMMGIPASAYRATLLTISMGVGATTGLFILQVVAGPLRKFGSFTPIEFLTDRYGKYAAGVGLVVLLVMQFAYLTANLTGFGLILQWVFGFPYVVGIIVGAAILLSITFIGGMWGITQGAVVKAIIIVAFMTVALVGVAYVSQVSLWGLPWFSSDLGKIVAEKAAAIPGWGMAKDSTHVLQCTSMAIAFLFGVAGMPHLVVRVLTSADRRTAQRSLTVTILVFGFVYLSAVALGWYGQLVFPDYAKNMLSDRLVLDLIGKAGIWVTGLYLCALMATVLVTAGTILLAVAAVIANDIYKGWFRPDASQENLLLVGKVALLVVTIGGILMAIKPPTFIALIVAWAFGLCGSTLAPAYILGLFWKRPNETGIVCGMIVGALSYGLMSYFKVPAAIAGGTPALISVPLAFVVTAVVSALSTAPSEEILARVAETLE